MAVFKKAKKFEDGMNKKVVGAYLPLLLIEFMTLYAMDLSVSNASIIVDLLEAMKLDKEKQGVDKDFLTESLAMKAVAVFKSKDNKKDLKTFIADLKKELSKKELSEETVNSLLTIIKNEAKK